MHRPYEPRRKVKQNLLKQKCYGDFEYFVVEKPKPKMCFGSDAPRDVLPLSGPGLSPFMRRNALTIMPDLCPNTHVDGRDAFYRVTTRHYSKLGLGPRAPRFTTKHEYQPPLQEPPPPKPWKQNCAPFNSTRVRNTSPCKIQDIPAACDYLPSLKKRQEIKFHYSFQGKKTLICPVSIKCVPYNLDVCAVCGCSCSAQGDYWTYNNKVALCRRHYDRLFVHCLAKFQGLKLASFKPIRDCYFAHAHNSCKASMKIMPVEEINKKLRKEAYLDLYFPLRRFCDS